MSETSIEDMTTFCKRKGFVYASAEIYGGLSGFFDFAHLGVELKNNIKQEWWKTHVKARDDIVGIDGSIITNPKVWHASGHVENFDDIMLTCEKCKHKVRADVFIEDNTDIHADGLSSERIDAIIQEHKLVCPKCKGPFAPVEKFNLMFSTNVGPKESSETRAFLRPETAQLIFANFRLVQENARMRLPFGIAQIGKSFRNEISPRDFLFRCREFEQMEIEYFINPGAKECPLLGEVKDEKLMILTAKAQADGTDAVEMTVQEALKSKTIKTQWHAYWLAYELRWFTNLGAKREHFRVREHVEDEKSHYATETWDLEYKFPFGYKELQGIANRGDFDLKQHIEHSKKDLSIFDEESKTKVIPHVVAEPSLGVERAFLVFMFDAYDDDKERGNVVLHLHPKLAPTKLGIFPLTNKLKDEAKRIYNDLKMEFTAIFDTGGSIGRRYARADEQGIPFCITFDFDSLQDTCVTVRHRDSTKQERVEIDKLEGFLRERL